MFSLSIKVGTILTLEPSYSEKVEKYRCKVVDTDDTSIFIDYPIDSITNKTVFLMDGSQLRASFYEHTSAAFAFPTEVLGKKKGQIPMIRLSYPGKEELIRIQRRDFVRVMAAVDVSIQFEDDKYQFVADDISAGGMAVILNKKIKFKDGDTISLLIPLAFNNGDIKYVTTTAHVIRIFEKSEQHIASIQFTDTDDLDKQLIVRYCFERQLMLRKKGLN
ncbi:flagellar brake domain-containing protein [Psychrobacillus sp.]|uniref:flagellar brake protein n=1 Tax=Psychrobacillus sp. TaxID=1871623 RepID=UPI0028BE6C22|nr:flagellar brake domain-containing protein [Psychrobacillus sp.]